MVEFVGKAIVSGLLVALAGEAMKRSTTAAAVLISLPLTSILAFFWLYRESGSIERVSELSHATLWIVLPSVVLFIAMPLLLRAGLNFYLALPAACGIMAIVYAGYVVALGKLGVKL